MVKLSSTAMDKFRPPTADKPNSRAGKVKTWMILDLISHDRRPRFYLCHESFKPPSGLDDDYVVTYHPGIGADPTEQEQKLRAFKDWAGSSCLRNVPNEVEVWQVDLDPEEAEIKKPFYESFCGFKLVEWTRKIPYVQNSVHEVEQQSIPDSRERTGKGKGKGKVKSRTIHGGELESMTKEEIEMEKLRRAEEVAWVTAKALNQPRMEWNMERDGLRNTRTARYFVQMPDYCFIGDDLEPEERKAWDAFGECSRATFNMSMQRVEGVWVEFKCKEMPTHDYHHWRAYLYEPRPMRAYDGDDGSKKRKRHPLTEEETEHEHQTKRRWSTINRVNRPQAPSTLCDFPQPPSPSQQGQPSHPSLRQSPPDVNVPHLQATEVVAISSDSSSSYGSSSDEEPESRAEKISLHKKTSPTQATQEKPVSKQSIAPKSLLDMAPPKQQARREPARVPPEPEQRVQQDSDDETTKEPVQESLDSGRDESTRGEISKQAAQEIPGEVPNKESASESTSSNEDEPRRGEQTNQEENTEAQTASSSSTDSSALSSAMGSEELNELEQGTEVWKGKQNKIGLQHKKMEDL